MPGIVFGGAGGCALGEETVHRQTTRAKRTTPAPMSTRRRFSITDSNPVLNRRRRRQSTASLSSHLQRLDLSRGTPRYVFCAADAEWQASRAWKDPDQTEASVARRSLHD